MGAKEYKARVTGFKMLTPTVFQLDFKTQGERFDFEGGQFISVVIPGAGPNGRDLRRAYSIASEPENPTLQLCVKIVEGGPGTTFLKQLRPGDEFRIFASYGNFVYKPKEGRNACFISTGTGLAPFRSMIRSEKFKKNPPTQTWCLHGVRYVSEILYDDEFKSLIDDLNWIPAVSRPEQSWSGFKGRVTDFLRQIRPDFPWKETDYYLCGGSAMISEVKSILSENGVEKTSIYEEVYYKE
jgi:ferredoxin-NADP reductase